MSKEEYFFKKEQKEKEKIRRQRQKKIKKKIKKITWWIAAVLIVGGGVLAGGWFLTKNYSPSPESEIISKNGLHWHPNLSIKILGKEQEIPAGIGLAITERPIHTHDSDGIIHLEFSGLVQEDDLRLSRFFEIWSKKFTKDCIFDKCTGPEGQVKMFVNGEPNSEFENYIMQDNDKIEIIFEQ